MDTSSAPEGGKLLLGVYAASLVAGAFLEFMYGQGSGLYLAGKILGIWGLTALSFQSLLVSRIELPVRYERLTRWHAANALLVTGLVVVHPLAMVASGFIPSGIAFITYLGGNTAAALGAFTALIILFQAGTTLYWQGMDYERWRWIHRAGYLAVALGFLHGLTVGPGIGTATPLTAWWLILGVSAASGFLHRYLVLPRKRKKFTVMEVKEEAEKTHTIRLKPEEQPMEHEPGQFAFTRFNSENLPEEEHPFTIASAPENLLEFTVRESGDYTSGIGKLEPGDSAWIEGPYGRFNLPDRPTVMIAGGIGITPFMSMLREMDGKNRSETRLVYGNRTLERTAFRDELQNLEEENDWLEVTHVLSDEDREGFRHGTVDDVVKDDERGPEFMVCGPEKMVETVRSSLKEMGVRDSRIHSERFSLRELEWP